MLHLLLLIELGDLFWLLSCKVASALFKFSCDIVFVGSFREKKFRLWKTIPRIIAFQLSVTDNFFCRTG